MVENERHETLSRCLFRAGATHAFLREPLEKLERIPDPSLQGLATDGVHVFYGPSCAADEASVGHLLMHCLFRHMLPPENAVRPLWNLACDIAAEYLRTEFFPSGDTGRTRMLVEDALPEGVDPRVAGAVYRSLMDLFDDELDGLYVRFGRDDHRYWYAPPAGALFGDVRIGAGEASHGVDGDEPAHDNHFYSDEEGTAYAAWIEKAMEALWPSELELPGGAVMTGRRGLAPGSRAEKMLLREAGKYDFTRYLRRFSTTQEELRLDLSGFDYIPYCYGLARYGNLPFIEPLEYAESHKVETLVIAIDTSGSCTRAVVERFLAEIENILMRHDYFFSRMNIHIMQCDAFLQSDVVIHSIEDWKRYLKDLVIKGRGGTDFRPVFSRVEQLMVRGALKHIKGLLYFTDGDGVYPREKPRYETAFVFSTRKALNYKKPEWIIPLCLEPGWGGAVKTLKQSSRFPEGWMQ